MTMIDLHSHVCSCAPKNIPIERIVTDYFDANYEENVKLAKCRKRELVLTRQLSMHFTYKYYGKDGVSPKILSLAKIGSQIGGKDHATVVHARKVIKNQIQTNQRLDNNPDVRFSKMVNDLEDHILQVKSFEFYSYLINKRYSIAETTDGLLVQLLEFDFKITRKWKCKVVDTENIVYRLDNMVKPALIPQL